MSAVADLQVVALVKTGAVHVNVVDENGLRFDSDEVLVPRCLLFAVQITK